MMTPEKILAALGAPAPDTLPEQWRPLVYELAATVAAQGKALGVAEAAIVAASQAETLDDALRTLGWAHDSIAKSLDRPRGH
ncbi:hypothetical protein [Thioalkalivibrio sp. ALJ15]|uniref:hypothetical protein n=1 Tax=Thioalkalivibrio sp. ALJ15 TaxID=748652 RepID=UPI0003759CD5|nr:hypothetical protein [Thioalkalivibrio sp. ALJ15]